MSELLTGNEAVARGAYEAGIGYVSAYPGTPSTEILENIAAQYKNIFAEWAPNEKVALECCIGSSIAGVSTMCTMKHVGVNVAADPLFSFAYAGVNAGLILVSADDPGLHSSQNEQDNRMYAKFAKMAMVEPSDSQESKDMVKEAVRISEEFDVPVLFRMTTRICHSKSLVEPGEQGEITKKPYVKKSDKYDLVPAVSKRLHVDLEQRLKKLEAFSNSTPLNYFIWNDTKIGVITSGVAFQYAQEVFGDTASYLKLGFTHPLPMEKIREFASRVDTLYIVEELEPYIEDQVKAAGISCIGKEKIPNTDELSPAVVAEALLGKTLPVIDTSDAVIPGRPPTLCAGCPHRGFFSVLGKMKNVMITGDIGCYSLGGAAPLNAKDTTICMGASISMGHGAQKAFDIGGEEKRTVSTIGDSTFFHTGINSLLHVAYNGSKTITCILDNRITAMTGHQENPGTGYTLMGEPATEVDIPSLVRAIGIKDVFEVNPNKLDEVKDAFKKAMDIDGPSVIITRWPCILKKFTEQDKEEFPGMFGLYEIDREKCTGCKACIRTGCPALRFDKEAKKSSIDPVQCVGCGVCYEVCKFDAIHKVEE